MPIGDGRSSPPPPVLLLLLQHQVDRLETVWQMKYHCNSIVRRFERVEHVHRRVWTERRGEARFGERIKSLSYGMRDDDGCLTRTWIVPMAR